MAKATLDTKELANKITLHVTIKRVRQWRWRVTVGMWLIRLAGLIMWMPIEIEFPLERPRATLKELDQDSRALTTAIQTATDFITLDELKADYEKHQKMKSQEK